MTKKLSDQTLKPNRKITIISDSSNTSFVLPQVEDVMQDAIAILALEMAKLKKSVMHNPRFLMSKEEATLLNRYVKSLVDLSREKRENDKQIDLDGLTQEELLKLANESLNIIEKK